MAALVLSAIGILIALWQLRRHQKSQRVDRAITLHRDITSGEVGAARERFTTAMWWAGRDTAGRCEQPTWESLDDTPPTPGPSHRYDPAITADASERPLRDLYRVLYCFERIDTTLKGGAVDQRLAWQLLAHHAVWWDALTANISDGSGKELGTRHIRSLRELASWARRGRHRHLFSPSRQELKELEAWLAEDFAEPGPGFQPKVRTPLSRLSSNGLRPQRLAAVEAPSQLPEDDSNASR